MAEESLYGVSFKFKFQKSDGTFIESNSVTVPKGEDASKIVSCSIEDYVEDSNSSNG